MMKDTRQIEQELWANVYLAYAKVGAPQPKVIATQALKDFREVFQEDLKDPACEDPDCAGC